MDKINVKIEGRLYEVDASLTVLEACRSVGFRIPTLCYWNHGHNSLASCRVCLVEISSPRGSRLYASCVYPIKECPAEKGFEIKISSPMAVEARKTSVELLLSNHSKDCQTCVKNGHCELLHVANITGAEDNKYLGARTPVSKDELAPGIIRDSSKCILCGDCVRVCNEVQHVGAIDFAQRGSEAIVTPAFGKKLAETDCVNCGQCAAVCPTAAIRIQTCHNSVWREIYNPKKRVVAQIAPAVRVAIGEAFGLKPGGLRRGIRYLPWRGPDHHGGSEGAGGKAGEERGCGSGRQLRRGESLWRNGPGRSRNRFRQKGFLPSVHLLLPGLDPVRGKPPSGGSPLHFHLQIPDGNVRRGDQGILQKTG